jgi:hypothetical protein
MKPIDNSNGEDRAVTALLGNTAALTSGIVTTERKPEPGLRSQHGSLVKGGLNHA